MAEKTGHTVSTAHLLLAIIEDRESIAFRLLKRLEVDTEALRQETIGLHHQAVETPGHTDAH